MRTSVLARLQSSDCRRFAGPTWRRLTSLLVFGQQHPPGLCRPPARPNRGVTLPSGRLLRYSKPPLNIPDQLQQLRERDLLVGSDDLALNALELIGYYRLSAYWLFFEEPPAPGETRSHRFRPGTSFEQVIELYNKDRLIRLLVIDAIERIEIAARSAWVQEMSRKHGPHCYLDPLLFRPDFNHGEQLEQLRSQIQQSNETFVIHYRQTYSEPELPPIWAMTELISLGTLRAWIAASELDSKTKVARSLGMPSAQVLNGVLHSLNLIRNISAHHGRLWNRLIVKRLPKIKKLQHILVLEDVDGEGVQPSKNLYNYLVVMAIIVRKVAPLSTWPSRMAKVISPMPSEQQEAMGCPVGWQEQQIWS
jgi:abortive infection bacteriophage resistance protein